MIRVFQDQSVRGVSTHCTLSYPIMTNHGLDGRKELGDLCLSDENFGRVGEKNMESFDKITYVRFYRFWKQVTSSHVVTSNRLESSQAIHNT